ncbi:MAG: hypothetical protein ACFFDK_07740 [Promethearchaeota archaeon]
MSTYLISPEFVLGIQIISIIGFLFLGGYTFYSYHKLRNLTLLYISLAFLVIAISILLKITILPLAENMFLEGEILEAIFEGTQFLAAFFFFYGLRIIKRKEEGGN